MLTFATCCGVLPVETQCRSFTVSVHLPIHRVPEPSAPLRSRRQSTEWSTKASDGFAVSALPAQALAGVGAEAAVARVGSDTAQRVPSPDTVSCRASAAVGKGVVAGGASTCVSTSR